MTSKQRFVIHSGLALLLLFATVGCSPAVRQPIEASQAKVEAREIAFAATMAARDPDGFLTFISPEAVFFHGNTPLVGLEAIARAWAPFFEGPEPPFAWRPDVVVVLESGRLALSSGPVLDPAGRELGRFNTVWRKDGDGQWRVVFDKGS
jgi:ketosteroid isomerase-like protein